MIRLRTICVALCVVCCATSHARLGAAAPRDDAREQARPLALEGVALTQQDRCAEGIDKLRQAEALFHAPTHLLWMARAYACLGRLLDAHAAYVTLLEEPIPNYAPQAFHKARRSATEEVVRLRQRVATLRVRVTAPAEAGLVVRIDGVDVSRRLRQPIAVEPGTRRVELHPSHGEPLVRLVTAQLGRIAEVRFELPKGVDAEAGGPDGGVHDDGGGSSGMLVGALVAYGIGGAGLIGGSIVGAVSLVEASDIKGQCDDQGACPTALESEAEDAMILGNLSNALFVIAGAGAALGTVLLLLQGDSPEPPPEAAGVTLRMGPATMSLSGRF